MLLLSIVPCAAFTKSAPPPPPQHPALRRADRLRARSMGPAGPTGDAGCGAEPRMEGVGARHARADPSPGLTLWCCRSGCGGRCRGRGRGRGGPIIRARSSGPCTDCQKGLHSCFLSAPCTAACAPQDAGGPKLGWVGWVPQPVSKASGLKEC